jgi:hypothetical protein
VLLNSINIFRNNNGNVNLNRSGNFLGSSIVGIPKDDIRDKIDE